MKEIGDRMWEILQENEAFFKQPREVQLNPDELDKATRRDQEYENLVIEGNALAADATATWDENKGYFGAVDLNTRDFIPEQEEHPYKTDAYGHMIDVPNDTRDSAPTE